MFQSPENEDLDEPHDSLAHRNGDEEIAPDAADPLGVAEAGGRTGSKALREHRRRQSLAILGGVLLGSLAVVLILLAVMIARRDAPPPLTRAAYEAALATWESNGPPSYDLDLTLHGRQPGEIHVEVRNRQVTKMTRDGREPKQRRTWDYWTVPGQFDTIDREFEMAANPMNEFHTPPGSVVQQAEFDPQFGFPRRYRRYVLGTEFEIDWKIVRFQVLDTQ